MALDRDELKKLLKEKGVKSLDDFNAFMREVSKTESAKYWVSVLNELKNRGVPELPPLCVLERAQAYG